MNELESVQSIPFWLRMLRALQWFMAGIIAFLLIGFGGASSIQKHQAWPLYRAEVISTKIGDPTHYDNYYSLTIHLRVHHDEKTTYETSLYQEAPLGALESRVRDEYMTGNWVEVRSEPGNPHHVVLNISRTWPVYLVGAIVGLLIFINGFKTLGQSAGKKGLLPEPRNKD